MSEPTRITVVRWRCDACRRSWSSRANAREHLARCWYRDENRSCKTCQHFGRLTNGAEACRAGLTLPTELDRAGRLRPTLAVNCPAHKAWTDDDRYRALFGEEPPAIATPTP